MIRNWRYKAGLFLTGMAVGCALFLEVSAKQAAGIALIGFALSWLFGSLTPRTLGVAVAIVICGVGLYLAVAPVWSDWNSTQKSAAEYDHAIYQLQYEVESAPRGNTYTDLPKGAVLIRFITIPDSAKNWIRPEKKAEANWNPSFPETMSDAEIMKDFQTNLLLPRPTFSFATALRAHVWTTFGGLAIVVCVALGIWGFKSRKRAQKSAKSRRRLEAKKQAIIDRGAAERKTIEMQALKERMEKINAEYAGENREAYVAELDGLLSELAKRYGERIPVDHAYKIMKDLEEGRGILQ